MCGIAVIVSTSMNGRLAPTIEAMTDILTHRGPDARGVVVLDREGVALGMRRLSILDVEGGVQPMWDEDERHCLVFNGEIYNFAELRRELVAHGHRFRTDHSDTEVIVHGFEEWGFDLFPRLNGMFAVAIWDRHARRLVLARDRTGEKPMYVAKIAGGFAVASELKGILEVPEVDRTIDPIGLEQYLSLDYVLAPRTILSSVQKLPAAHYAVIEDGKYETFPYWQPQFGQRTDESQLLGELDETLDRSVREKMVADVPVGLFLSGGLDSTTVGYYMRRHSDDVHSFSIGFDVPEYDESAYADLAARHLGTKHHLEVFSQERVRELVPRVTEILDEPMGDQSIFPTYLLSQFTSSHVKVALGGDGSDELLMGYKAYPPLRAAWELERLPLALRRTMAASARRLPRQISERGVRGVQFASRLAMPAPQRLLSHLACFKGNAQSVLQPSLRDQLSHDIFDEVNRTLVGDLGRITPADQTVAAYLRGYLQHDILVKVDRASMAASLEVRSPFLDPAFIDLALGISPRLRLKRFQRKYLLCTLMRGRIPDAIIDRPKLGFGVPLNHWFRESLSGLVKETLAPSELAADGLFDPVAVSRLVQEHLSGAADRGNELWILVQFQLWKDRWLR